MNQGEERDRDRWERDEIDEYLDEAFRSLQTKDRALSRTREFREAVLATCLECNVPEDFLNPITEILD